MSRYHSKSRRERGMRYVRVYEVANAREAQRVFDARMNTISRLLVVTRCERGRPPPWLSFADHIRITCCVMNRMQVPDGGLAAPTFNG